jgi:DNA-binding NarL/FixJ family response regulator
MSILLLSDDLLFASRVTGSAKEHGIGVSVCRTPEILLIEVQTQLPTCVILDLSNPGLNVARLVPDLKRRTPPPKVVAYGSHVDVETLKAARAAGCDLVLPRSQFVEELPRALPEWARG